MSKSVLVPKDLKMLKSQTFGHSMRKSSTCNDKSSAYGMAFTEAHMYLFKTHAGHEKTHVNSTNVLDLMTS